MDSSSRPRGRCSSPYSRPSHTCHVGRSIRFQGAGDALIGETSGANVAADQLAPDTTAPNPHVCAVQLAPDTTTPNPHAPDTPNLANGMSASERILLHKLKKDTKDQSTQILKLTNMLAVAVQENVSPPRCTQWEFVKRRLAAIVRSFLLGKDPSTSCIHPSQECIKRAILKDFGVCEDPIVCKQFDQAWGPQSSTEPGLQAWPPEQSFTKKLRHQRSHYKSPQGGVVSSFGDSQTTCKRNG